MRAEAIELFSAGVRRPSDEVKAEQWAPGWLTVGDLNGMRMAWFKRPASGTGDYANLRVDHFSPLFDPVLRGMNDETFVIHGVQRRHDDDGRMHEEMQAWWIRLPGSRQ